MSDREFTVGETTVLTFTIPDGRNLTTASVRVAARRDYDDTVVIADAFNLQADGQGQYSVSAFTGSVLDPTGTDLYTGTAIQVIDGSETNDFRVWPPDGRFTVVTLP